MFVAQHADDDARIDAAIAIGDREQARLLAHSLKGAAATLGATPLRAAAAALEAGLRVDADREHLVAVLADLQRHHRDLIDGLHRWLAAGKEAAMPAATVPPGAPPELLERLAACLRVGDLQAVGLWQEHAAAFAAALGPAAAGIGQAIERYDFAAALGLLEAARS
jgi:HPt (histidine-containing phosphotransfer) domain-containing protein